MLYMAKGKWYFLCTQFDTMENRSAKYEEKTALQAVDEETALSESVNVWEQKTAKSYKGWDGETYPKNPRVIYEVAFPQ